MVSLYMGVMYLFENDKSTVLGVDIQNRTLGTKNAYRLKPPITPDTTHPSYNLTALQNLHLREGIAIGLEELS